MRTTPGAGCSSACATTPTSAPSSATPGAALDGRAFDPERHLQRQHAEQHQLYLIPAGTPHASGAGNVVLEISATPYLYTLRFYDWLRRDLEGTLRPVHLEHAFANLDRRRRGEAVAPRPDPEPAACAGHGWEELELGGCPSCSTPSTGSTSKKRSRTTRRVASTCSTSSREARSSVEHSAGPPASLAYAETMIVPASVGPYRLRRLSGPPAKVIKAFVKP